MFGFIYLLKALASILITNSHLGNMYPSEFMALSSANDRSSSVLL